MHDTEWKLTTQPNTPPPTKQRSTTNSWRRSNSPSCEIFCGCKCVIFLKSHLLEPGGLLHVVEIKSPNQNRLENLKFCGSFIILYLSGINMMAAILNNKQQAMVGAKTKMPNQRMWEEQYLDPTNNYLIVGGLFASRHPYPSYPTWYYPSIVFLIKGEMNLTQLSRLI